MPGLEEIKWFSTLGVGGALALFVYMMYRKDFLRERKKDRKSTRLNSSHIQKSRMPSSA